MLNKIVLKNSFETGGATIRNYSDLYNNQGQYVSFPSKADEMMKSRIGVMVYSQKTDPYGNPIIKIKFCYIFHFIFETCVNQYWQC